MLLACQLLCESAEQQAQRFITTTGKEKPLLCCCCEESQSWKALIYGDNWSIGGDTLGFCSTNYFEEKGRSAFCLVIVLSCRTLYLT